MEGFVAPVETIPDERAEHPELFVNSVKEPANMAISVERVRRELKGLRGDRHIFTSRRDSRVLVGGPVAQWAGGRRRTGLIPAGSGFGPNRAL
jgi:hypothetical protein